MSPTPAPLRLLLLGLLLTPAIGAQAPLTVAEALRRADARGYATRIATAGANAATARAGATLKGILPTARVEAGWVRSTDPLATFGAIMRQRQVTPEAFDPASLNYPAARSDVSSGLVIEVPLLNADAWAGRAAARHAADAAHANADWVASGLRLDVIRAYYGAVLATDLVATLEAATTAASAHVRQAESAVTNGVATRSDMLLATVKQGEIETQLVAARGQASLARLQLALLLGSPGDTAFALPRAIPADPIAPPTTTPRADLRSAAAGLDAARAARRATELSLVPRLNGFARYDWHDPRSLAGGKTMWTVGVMANWSLFSGGAELAQRREATANVRAAEAGHEAAQAMATLEVEAAEISVTVATQTLQIATRAVAQSSEAHRIVGRKYDGGLAAVTELLDAQAAELATRLAAAKARYDLLVARAALARARGNDMHTLAAELDAAAGTRE